MKVIESDRTDLMERLRLEARKPSGSDVSLKITVLRRVFFGCTLLGSMIAYLWVLLPQF